MPSSILALVFSVMGTLQLHAQQNVIPPSGDVGLGTLPTEKLDVNGNLKIRGDLKVQDDLKINSLAGPGLRYVLINSNGKLVAGSIVEAGNGNGNGGNGNSGPTANCNNNNFWRFNSNTKEIYTCDDLYNVGIGLNNPDYKLHVNGNTATSSIFGLNEQTTFNIFANTDSKNGPTIHMNGWKNTVNPGRMSFVSTNMLDTDDNSLAFQFSSYNIGEVSWFNKMVITHKGNVGIDVSNPIQKLQVKGTGRFEASENPDFYIDIFHDNSSGHINTTDKGLLLNYYSERPVGVNGVFTTNKNSLLSQEYNAYTTVGSIIGNLNQTKLLVYGNTKITNNLFVDGNLGVGINNPQDKLHVEGVGRFSNTNGSISIFYNTVNGHVNTENGSLLLNYYNNNPVVAAGSSFTSTNNTYLATNSGNVGIGINNPTQKLHVNGNVLVNEKMSIGGAPLHCQLTVQNDICITGVGLEGGQLNLSKEIGGQFLSWSLDNYDGNFRVFYNGNNPAIFINKNNNNVGIGTDKTSQDYKLTVEGNLRAREVEVNAYTWYDNVFKDDYSLMPLKEVSNFIKTHNHLPEIPSEKDVLINGIKLGEFNGLLLKKIEELTLYVIELSEENKKLHNLIKELK